VDFSFSFSVKRENYLRRGGKNCETAAICEMKERLTDECKFKKSAE
jgi:hypothetical protein